MRRTPLFLALLLVSTLLSGANAAPPARSVRQAGAKGDGKADDTAAFQRAIDETSRAGGGTVWVDRGNYLIKSHITVKKNVALQGVWSIPTARTQLAGSTLLAVEEQGGLAGEPFITLNENGALKGLTVYYPNQSHDVPKPYPWAVRGIGDNCSLVDVLLVNPYAAVDFGTNPCGRHYINGLYAQALYRGIFIDKCYDVGRISNVHLWPFWDNGEKLHDWTLKNAEAFTFGRTDWEYCSNCFCIWFATGYHFVANADGPGNVTLTQCGSDDAHLAVQVDALQAHAGVTFSNSQFMAGVVVAPTCAGPVKFTSCGFWGQPRERSQIVHRGTGALMLTACHFSEWDTASACIDAANGSLIVNGCEFVEPAGSGGHIALHDGLRAATIFGNLFRGGQPKIRNTSRGDVQIVGNASEDGLGK